MDLRRIRHFVVLAETLNFRRAAERLHMAQPPLTVSIQKLESELGARLFDRGPSGVALTSCGRALLPEARKLLFHGTQLAEVVRHGLDGTGGSLQVGFVGTSTWGMLQRVLPQFRAQYPGVELVLHEATSVNILRQLEDHVLDVGIVRTPLVQPTSATLAMLERHVFVAALPRGHALARNGSLRLGDLAHEPFIMYAPSAAGGLHSAAMLACQHGGFVPRVEQQGIQVQTVLALVESGLGVALVPSLMQRYASDKIVYREIVDQPQTSGLGLAVAFLRDEESPAAMRFRQVAETVFAT